MLSELNQFAKDYEYLIKAIGTLLPFLVTLFMAIIAYQQWLINKRNEYISYSEKMLNKIYKPLKSCTEEFNKILLNSEDKVNLINSVLKYVNVIKDIIKENSYLICHSDYEMILCSLKHFINNLEQLKNQDKNIKKRLIIVYKLLCSGANSFFALRELDSYRFDRNLTIYEVIFNFIIAVYTKIYKKNSNPIDFIALYYIYFNKITSTIFISNLKNYI